ncbi:MAG: hypothetical protein M3P45_03130 [Acidobacteriota bacterium]|nr:hypothetical protein [Acidobacteriota bacterium]
MKKLCGYLVGLCLAIPFTSIAAAQDKPASNMAPPKVLTITREFVKPGKTGSIHDKAESAFVKAMTAAKSKTYYIGLDSLSGKLRSLFLTGYDSFDAWEKDQRAQQKDPTLGPAIERALTADAALLEAVDQSVWIYREDQSRNQPGAIGDARYMEFEVFRVKPGHEGDWAMAVKLVQDAYAKAVPDGHWAMYQLVFGGSPSYVVITPLKSAAEIDKNFMADKQFMDAMGTEGMKKLSELSAAAIESVETNLFSMNPHMSYVSDEMAAQAPDFWRPKTPATKHEDAKPKEKPATP